MYLKVGTTHFYRLALYNLVLGITTILLNVQMMNVTYGDMTLYGHATIIGALLGQLIFIFTTP